MHPPPSPAQANFTLMTECTPESRRCYSVYSVAETTPPPRVEAHKRERHWSAKIDDISLRFPEEWSRREQGFGSGFNQVSESVVRIRNPDPGGQK